MTRLGSARYAPLAAMITALGVASAIGAPRDAADVAASPRRLSNRATALVPMIVRASRAKTMMTCSTSLTAVSPCAVSTTQVKNTGGFKQIFTITNKIVSEPATYSVSCAVSGSVSSCSVPSSLTINQNSSKPDTVTYATGAVGTGTVTLTVDDGSAPVVATLTVTVVAPPPVSPFHLVALSPHYESLEDDPSQTDTAVFALTNAGTETAWFRYTRTCSGSGITSGCTPATDSANLSANAAATVKVIFTTSATVGQTGTVRLVVRQVGDTLTRDSASIDVSVTRGTTGVATYQLNPGSIVDRNLCLTISAGAGAAVECGDLRLVHVFPSVRTYNKVRAPTLLYNSAHAHPFVTIRADYTLPTTGGVPTTVSAVLKDSAGASLATGSWSGSQWAAGATRRIAVSFDASTKATGIYKYRLVVTRTYSGSSAQDSALGEFVVVNRMKTPFGPGWWLAGLEQLSLPGTSTMLWVGGDGSARKYAQVNDTTWGAANVNRPDSIKKRIVNGATVYERLLPQRLVVRFDITGRHIATINRLNHVTSFGYSTLRPFRLDTILVPPSTAGMRFLFAYDSVGSYGWRLKTLTAPALGTQARIDSLFYSGSSQVTSVKRIDASTTSFGYDAGASNRITARTNERGYATTYAYGSGSVVTQVSVPLDASTNAVTTLTPWETRGLSGTTAVSVDMAYAKLDGPRTDVADTTLFWLDRFGAPRRVRNALGDETTLARDTVRWPGLVIRLRSATGQVFRATYDARGNDSTTTDSASCDAARGLCATTKYSWLPTWDLPIKIVNPDSDFVRFGYDTLTGNKIWQEDGRGAMSRVTFLYDTSPGLTLNLPRASQLPTGESDSIFYDGTLGNLALTKTPLGSVEKIAMDAIGRVLTDSTPTTSGWRVRTTALDLIGQDTMSKDSAGSGSQSARLHVHKHFDVAGNMDTLITLSTPDPGHIGEVKQLFSYDRANRKTQETLIGFNTFTWTYDAAGNLLSGGRTPTTNSYDALNRVIKKVADDTATFRYDAAGRVLAANNSSARIARSYYPNGALRADTLRIATDSIADQNFATVYALSYRYDLNGRRTWYSDNLQSTSGVDTVSYAYDPVAGFLTQLTDLFGHRFTFTYDADARPATLTRFADKGDSAVVETRAYDADGRLRARRQQGKNFTLNQDSLLYNVQNKVIFNYFTHDTVGYNALGQLTYAHYQSGAWDRFDYDANGNQDSSYVIDPDGTSQVSSRFVFDSGSNRLNHAIHPAGPFVDTTNYHTDGMGRQNLEQHVHIYSRVTGDTATEARQTTSAFRSDSRLASTTYRLDSFPPPGIQYQSYSRIESYRYDALGRRVWKRILRDANCWSHDAASGCVSAVTRTVWDGDQVVYEIRASAGPNPGISGSQFGTVGYLHTFGIDEPVELFKGGASDIVLPYLDWRGNFNLGTCPLTACAGDHPVFPNSGVNSYGGFFPLGTPSWYGDVIGGQQDASGLLYRRNRYLDARTGRFTQEDPIGLAGGLNAYGYAGGDPISYDDPFGLCDPWPACANDYWEDAAVAAFQEGGAAGTAKAVGAVIMGTLIEGFSINLADQGLAQIADGHVLKGSGMVGLAVIGNLPGGNALKIEANLARTVKGAQGATVTARALGKFTVATWEVKGGSGGAARTVWSKVINLEGETVRLYHDSWDKFGNYMGRKFKLPNRGGPRYPGE